LVDLCQFLVYNIGITNEEENMQLSDKIRIIRKARGYSQEGLGMNLNEDGISRQTVSDWENGNCEPKLNNIRDLAKVLDVSFDALLDDSIDLNNKDVLNSVLHHLSTEQKKEVNSSFRYRIYEYTVTKKDYAKVITYFSIMLIALILCIVGLCLNEKVVFASILFGVGGYGFFLMLCLLYLPIANIKKIKRGGRYSSFGTLSQTHFVIIGWSDAQFDRTIYVPVTEIERMELGKDAKKMHGTVLVYLKGRTKPIQTSDIINPKKLIYVFNNLDSYVANSKGRGVE
jgi:transcriptional regulator with XRE-family HTH domain